MLAALAARIHAAAGVAVGAPPAARCPRRRRPWRRRPGTIPVAVVGAHLSGMPLNCELAARGGTFVTEAVTVPEYRLYALPGGPPQRPGLVRVRGGGVAIAVEVWALPTAAFGEFVGAVPAPLSIGTLRLGDGSSVHALLLRGGGGGGRPRHQLFRRLAGLYQLCGLIGPKMRDRR